LVHRYTPQFQLRGTSMGRHHEDDPERRRGGGLRWKGDTTGSLPVVPEWQEHEGITDASVSAFVSALHSTNPPGTDVPARHAKFAWLIERCSDRLISGEPVRRNAWVTIASGYSDVDYPGAKQAAAEILNSWFLWNGVTNTDIRKLHTIWTRHATEAAWTERLDGR
jgi:hypothetical protein